ncbi:Protein ssh4 [Savitreella phatthalungensis]
MNSALLAFLSTLGALLGLVLLACIATLYIRIVYLGQDGRILLGNTVPGSFDDEQQIARDEAMYLDSLDERQRQCYQRARAFQQMQPPESIPTDISLSQYLSIQEKGVSAWEFEPDPEATNCLVECRTELTFYDNEECCVQTNLPIPRQNDVYYWEAKVYELPTATRLSVGLTTKPYPTFRLPGFSRHSIAYMSDGERRHNEPFVGRPYGPALRQGDVVGCGYRARTGTIFFTRNGKKLEEAATGQRRNLFPSIGAHGPCSIHVNFGQAGFVFIEANVKKWGLAPMTGTLAPPPAYGSEEIGTSVLLAAGFGAPSHQPSRELERSASEVTQHSLLDSASLSHHPGMSLAGDISLDRLHVAGPSHAQSLPAMETLSAPTHGGPPSYSSGGPISGRVEGTSTDRDALLASDVLDSGGRMERM